MTTKPYTALIPGRIAWIPERDVRLGQFDPLKPSHLWRDNSLTGAWAWGGGPWWDPKPVTGSVTYRVIARNPNGSPKLTPIPQRNETGPAFDPFYGTYSFSISLVMAYQNFAFAFPGGVPYLEDLVADASQVKDINLPPVGQRPTWDYPVELRPDHLLIVQAGEVVAVQYQEFGVELRPPMETDAERMRHIRLIIAAGGTDTDMVQKIRLIVTNATVLPGLT